MSQYWAVKGEVAGVWVESEGQVIWGKGEGEAVALRAKYVGVCTARHGCCKVGGRHREQTRCQTVVVRVDGVSLAACCESGRRMGGLGQQPPRLQRYGLELWLQNIGDRWAMAGGSQTANLWYLKPYAGCLGQWGG